MNRKRIFAILACLIMAVVVCFCSFAASGLSSQNSWDVGNYNDYGGGDYGGWDYDDNDDYYGGGYVDYGGGGGSGGSGGSRSTVLFFSDNPILAAIIVVVIIVIVIFGFATKKRHGSHGAPSAQPVRPQRPQRPLRIPGDHTAEISAAIRKIDPNFSVDRFITWSKDVFITLQQAWTARDWSTIRPLEKEELFEQHKRQLDEYIRNNTINVIERINVGQTHLHKYERDAQYEYLTVYMATRMVDYIINADTKLVIKGDPNSDCYMNYLLTFMRKTGVKSKESMDSAVSKSCPNCGAPLSITSSGKCDYCGSIITTGDFDWVLAKMDAVKQNTVIDEVGVIINDGSENHDEQDDTPSDDKTNTAENRTSADNPQGDNDNISFEDMMNGDNDNNNN